MIFQHLKFPSTVAGLAEIAAVELTKKLATKPSACIWPLGLHFQPPQYSVFSVSLHAMVRLVLQQSLFGRLFFFFAYKPAIADLL
jgi:hypothetical protein